MYTERTLQRVHRRPRCSATFVAASGILEDALCADRRYDASVCFLRLCWLSFPSSGASARCAVTLVTARGLGEEREGWVGGVGAGAWRCVEWMGVEEWGAAGEGWKEPAVPSGFGRRQRLSSPARN